MFDSSLLPLSLLAGLAASVAGGIVGSYVLVKRILFISGSISHSVMAGMGLFLYLNKAHGCLWATPLRGALLAALVSAFLIGWIHSKYRQREDTAIAAIWSTGMAVGVIFLVLSPGYNAELMGLLFGNILWVQPEELYALFGFDLILLVITLLFHHRFVAVSFDETQAHLQALRVKRIYHLLLALVAVTTVLLIQVVGAILVIALLALPAAIASRFTRTLPQMMTLAVVVGIVLTTSGTVSAYLLNWPAGATIALVAALCYGISLIARYTNQRRV